MCEKEEDTHLEDIQDKGFYDRTFVGKNVKQTTSPIKKVVPVRTLLIDQGDVF